MFGTNYYTLVSGFRELSLGMDVGAVRTEVEEALTARDMKCVRLLYTCYDCENIAALHDGRTPTARFGQLSREELELELKSPVRLPERIARVIRAYADPEGEDAAETDVSVPFARALFAAYYEECAASPSRFLREWSEFDRTLRNVIAAAMARAEQVKADAVTVGGGETVEQLHRSSAADFGLRAELPYVDAVVSALNDGEGDLLERERKIDRIRWDMASELATFDYFDLDAVLSYRVKVGIVARWNRLDIEHGRRMLERLMAELDGSRFVERA